MEPSGPIGQIDGDRVHLVPVDDRHVSEMWEYWLLDSTTAWTFRRFGTRDEFVRSLGGPERRLAITVAGGVLVGDIGITLRSTPAQHECVTPPADDLAELSWALAPEHHGHGYAAEAVRTVIEALLASGVRKVVARCFAANVASRALMERVGMTQEAFTRNSVMTRDGEYADEYVYAVVRGA